MIKSLICIKNEIIEFVFELLGVLILTILVCFLISFFIICISYIGHKMTGSI